MSWVLLNETAMKRLLCERCVECAESMRVMDVEEAFLGLFKGDFEGIF